MEANQTTCHNARSKLISRAGTVACFLRWGKAFPSRKDRIQKFSSYPFLPSPRITGKREGGERTRVTQSRALPTKGVED
ncbi:hypothetical protein BRADI_1g08406v3 [Brachypodium distachyon]|uniref:Uncharacterized protein n=1 Tax=Brachypodium distachyon TaxID=15368 RepID=A0A2K2DIM8_BRADI|nr:hypothetical protein BRADI_1g08406v3 [Brachypodium distachyon]